MYQLLQGSGGLFFQIVGDMSVYMSCRVWKEVHGWREGGECVCVGGEVQASARQVAWSVGGEGGRIERILIIH